MMLLLEPIIDPNFTSSIVPKKKDLQRIGGHYSQIRRYVIFQASDYSSTIGYSSALLLLLKG